MTVEKVRCHRRRGLRRCRLELAHVFDGDEHEIGRWHVPVEERERLTEAEAGELLWFVEHGQAHDAFEYLAVARDIRQMQGSALWRATVIVFILCAVALIVLVGAL